MTCARRTQPKTRTRFRSAPMTDVAAAVAALLGACAAPTSATTPAPAMSPATSPNPATSTSLGLEVPAKPVLLAMAGTLTDAPADQVRGQYLHTTRVNVYHDMQYPRPTGGGAGEGPLVVKLHELWRSPDGSRGRQLATPYDTGSCTPGDDSTWNDNRYHVMFRPHAPADIDMKRLRALLVPGAGRTPTKPVDVLAGIAGTYEEDVAEKPVRAAMLRILAEQPGIVAREGATDQLGRAGVLVSLPYVDGEGVQSQYHLLFEHSTGVLFSAYETITGPLPATFDPRLGPDAAASVIASHDGTRLYLENRYTDDTAGTAVGCASPYTGVVRDLSRTLTAPAPTPAAPAAGGRP